MNPVTVTMLWTVAVAFLILVVVPLGIATVWQWASEHATHRDVGGMMDNLDDWSEGE